MDRHEDEMDAVLSEFGFDAFANGTTQKAGVSPKRKRLVPDFKEIRDRKFQGRMTKNQKQVREAQRQKIETSIKIGAQGFAETDWNPTDVDQDERMDMNCFQDLRSEMGIKSEFPNGNVLTNRYSGVEKKTQLTPRMFEQDAQKDEIRDDITNGITIESLLDPNFKDEKADYCLTLSIRYETNMGESMSVIGDIEELGNWKNFKCEMTWTEGHVWVLKDLNIKQKSSFNYKYVLMKNGKPQTWEQGQNRIADLRILKGQDGGFFGDKNTKHVEIFDEWQAFHLRIMTYSPDQNDQLYICGPLQELGNNQKPVRMQRIKPMHWMSSKYGEMVRPFEICIKVQSGNEEFQTFPKVVEYYYSYTDRRGLKVKEKVGIRQFEIQKPETYTGLSNNEGKRWIINGQITQNDGNFVGDRFMFNKINDTGIYIGSYPNSAKDVDMLHSSGIKQILSLLTEDENRLLNIRQQDVQNECVKQGVRLIKMPLKDINEEDYSFDLFRIAQCVSQIVDTQKQTLFIHCSSGVSRSATLAIVYLCIFKRTEYWQDVKATFNFVKKYAKIQPNIRAIENAINQNQGFQNKQRSRYGPKSSYRSKDDQIHEKRQFMARSVDRMPLGLLKTQTQPNIPAIDLQYETSSAMGEMLSSYTPSKVPKQKKSNETEKKEYEGRSLIRNNSKLKSHRSGSNFDRNSLISAPWDNETDTSKIEEDKMVTFRQVDEMNQEARKKQKEQLLSLQKMADSQKIKSEETKREMVRLQAEMDRKRIQQELEEKQKAKQAEVERQRILKEQEAMKAIEDAKRLKEQALIEQERIRKQAELEEQIKKETMRKMEEKLHREMEQKLEQQKKEAERLVREKELELQRFKQEEEEKMLQKEEKKRLKAQEEARREAEIKKARDEMEREVQILKQKLQEEQLIRQKVEMEQQKRLEEEKMKLQEENERKQQEEQAEIERLKQIQEALFAAQEQKRIQREIKKKKKMDALENLRRERELEEEEAKRVQDEIKRKIGSPARSTAMIFPAQDDHCDNLSQVMNTSQNTSIVRNQQVEVLGRMAELKREQHRKLMEEQDHSLDEARQRLEKEKSALQEAKVKAEEEAKEMEDKTKNSLQRQESHREKLNQLKKKDEEIEALKQQLADEIQRKKELEDKQKNDFKRMEDELKQSIIQWQKDEQMKRDQKQAEIEAELQARQQKLEESIRQQELNHLAKQAEEKRMQKQMEQEALIQKQITENLMAEIKRNEELLRKEKADREKELLQQIEKERKIQEDYLKAQEEKERQEQLRAAQLAKESEEKLKEEMKKLEIQKEQKQNRDLFDSAMARIAGEFIINQVEKEIIGIYEDLQEQERVRKEEEKRKQEEEKARLEEERIKKEEEDKLKTAEEEENERLRQTELEIQKIKEEQRKVAEQIKVNDTLDNIGSQIQIEIAALEEMKNQSNGSNKQRRSKKERSASPQKSILKFGDSFKISEKQDQDYENQNQSLAEIIDFGSEKALPKNQSMNILELKQLNSEFMQSRQSAYDLQSNFSKVKVVNLDDKLDFATHQEQEDYFDQLFSTPPIPFRPRKANKLDKAIGIILESNNFTIPVVNIRENLFLIGPNRVNCDFKYESVLVKVGGGSQKMQDYLNKNNVTMEAILIEHMTKSGKSIEWVIDQLKEGKKIPRNIGKDYASVISTHQSMVSGSRQSLSPRKARYEAQSVYGATKSPRKGESPVRKRKTSISSAQQIQGFKAYDPRKK